MERPFRVAALRLSGSISLVTGVRSPSQEILDSSIFSSCFLFSHWTFRNKQNEKKKRKKRKEKQNKNRTKATKQKQWIKQQHIQRHEYKTSGRQKKKKSISITTKLKQTVNLVVPGVSLQLKKTMFFSPLVWSHEQKACFQPGHCRKVVEPADFRERWKISRGIL